VEADSIRGLAEKLGLDPAALEGAISEFNAAVQPGEFNPAIKDGKRTAGIDPPKSNWAQPLDRPPFVAFPVTCGITFTYGGLRVDADSCVIAQSGRPIPGLFAAGELVGGLFYHNYPGGSGLMAGSVFGRRAGAAAGRRAGEAASRTL
jgi:tricarballylate dehydrogenase